MSQEAQSGTTLALPSDEGGLLPAMSRTAESPAGHARSATSCTCLLGDAVMFPVCWASTQRLRMQEAAQREGLLFRLYNIDFDQAKAGREGWFLYPRWLLRESHCWLRAAEPLGAAMVLSGMLPAACVQIMSWCGSEH